ncbi:mannose-ethanolamine phosphotransferase gpi13, partial [Spiromyces aspiralis]
INNELTHHGDVLSNIDASAWLFGWLKLDDSWNTVKLVASRLSLSVALGGGLSAWVFDPLCLNIAVVGPGSTDGDAQKSHPASDPASSKTAVILGFGNAYGSSYLVFLSIVFCILYVVQQPMGEIMLSAHFVQIILCVELFDSLRDCHQYALGVGGQRSSSHSSGISAPTSSMRRNKLTKKMVGPASTAREVHERRDAEIEYQRYSTYLIPQVIYLTLIAYVHYFSTGHQFNLATVHWSSAFVVLREVHFVLSGILVALNSLGSFLLVSLALPLVVLWNSPLSNKLLRHAPSWFTALLGQCMLVHFGYNAAIMTSTAICTSWLRRALHVWSIFVP